MHFFHKERNIAVPDEDNVEELDSADDGESVGEAQHPTHIGQQRGHAVRLGTRAVKGPVPREFECTHVLFFCPHQSPESALLKKVCTMRKGCCSQQKRRQCFYCSSLHTVD